MTTLMAFLNTLTNPVNLKRVFGSLIRFGYDFVDFIPPDERMNQETA